MLVQAYRGFPRIGPWAGACDPVSLGMVVQPGPQPGAGNTLLIARVPQVVLKMVTEIKKIPGISRVMYDLTSKPPGTTEWE